MHWSYMFLVLTHQDVLVSNEYQLCLYFNSLNLEDVAVIWNSSLLKIKGMDILSTFDEIAFKWMLRGLAN